MKRSMENRVKALQKKNDVRVDTERKLVLLLSGQDKHFPKANDLGNKSWGVIDFLVNIQGYKVVEVDKFNMKKHKKDELSVQDILAIAALGVSGSEELAVVG